MRAALTVGKAALGLTCAALLVLVPSPCRAEPIGGSWSPLLLADPEPRDTPSLVHDPVRNRLILFGGFDGVRYHDEVWELDPSGGDARRLEVSGPVPPARSRHLAVYDPITDALIVYGGWAGGSRFDDMWSLDLKPGGQWQSISSGGGPRPVGRSAMEGALDVAGHRLVISSGESNRRWLNDVWTFSLDERRWTVVRPETRWNLARSGMALAYDSRRNRWLGFGGMAGGAYNDLWAWDVGRKTGWTPLDYADEGPVALVDPCAVYDPVRDQLIVLGGSGNPRFAMELSTIDLSQETRGPRLRLPGVQPPALHGASAVYDPLHDRVLVFGGVTETSVSGEFWELSLGDDMRWRRLDGITLPPLRAFASSVYDAARQRWVVLFGQSGNQSLNDAWAFDLASEQWSPIPLTIQGTWPGGLHGTAAAYDPKGDRVLLFGGNNGSAVNQDTWELRLDTGTLTHLAYAGAYPLKRWFASAFYDPTRDEMMLFGGTPEGVSMGGVSYYDAWQFQTHGESVTSTLMTFPTELLAPHAFGSAAYDPDSKQLVIFGAAREGGGFVTGGRAMAIDDAVPEWRYGPGLVRGGASAVYDAVGRRTLMFGGDVGSVRANDTWQFRALPGLAFDEMATTGTPPPPRYLHAACFDADRQRMFVFGGALSWGTNVQLLGDLWMLDLSGTPTWTRLRESPAVPERRSVHAALYDAPRDRMLVFGGNTEDTAVWALPLGGPLRWTRLPTVGPSPTWRMGPGFVYDSRRDRAILVGGSRGRGQAFKDSWALTLGDTPTWSPIVPADPLPEGGENACTLYDAARDAVVTFGGDETTELGRFESPRYRPGVFSLSLEQPTWRRLDEQGGPIGNRTNQAAVYDASQRRIITFGGLVDRLGPVPLATSSGGTSVWPVCDTWAIGVDDSSFRYTRVDSCSGPEATFSPAVVIDDVNRRAYLSEGDARVWTLSLAEPGAWTELEASGPALPGRREHSAVFDSRRQRMIVFGGAQGTSSGTLDLWAFQIGQPTEVLNTLRAACGPDADTLHWEESDPGGSYHYVVSTDDHSGGPYEELARIASGDERATQDGRTYSYAVVADYVGTRTYRVTVPETGRALTIEVDRSTARVEGDGIVAYGPNPTHRGVDITFRLARAERVSLVLHDIAGRAVRTLVSSRMPPGTHTVTWDGGGRDGGAVSPGIYFSVLENERGERWRKRIVVMR